MYYMWLMLIGCIFALDEVWKDTRKGEQCKYVEYEAAKEINIDRIPSFEAQVPTTILMDMFGKNISKNLKNMDLGANEWMHFRNAAVAKLKILNTSPTLGPFLGCMGVALSGLTREFNTVTPDQLIGSVNEAFAKIIKGVNRQFETMEAMFHQELNKQGEGSLRKRYAGKKLAWVECLEELSTDDSDNCQKGVAERMVEGHLFFMSLQYFNEDKNKANNPTKLSDNDVKTLETQLPLLKIWAELHISIYAVLVKRFGNDKNSDKYMYFYGKMNRYGKKYIAYMEWAVQKIKNNRYLNQNGVQNFACRSPTHEEELYAGTSDCHSRLSCRKLNIMEQLCEFKCTSMSPAYCDQTITVTCENGCYLSSGVFIDDETITAINNLQSRIRNGQELKASETCKTYQDSLKPDVDNYWYKKIEYFIPKIRDILDNPGSVGDGNVVRQDVAQNDDGSGELLEEEQQFEAIKFKIQMEDKAIEEKAMQGITSTTTMSEYYAKLIENTSEERKKLKKERKKQKKNRAKKIKKKKKKKIGQ